MMWHDGRFGRDNRFLFYLYDRIRRWNAALGVHLKVKNDRESVDKFNRLILDPLISDRVTQAAANPANRDARLLMNLLKPLLVVSGRRVPFGPAERNDSISKMCAKGCHFGSGQCLQVILIARQPFVLQVLTWSFSCHPCKNAQTSLQPIRLLQREGFKR
eukprot:scpid92556/ scgid26070/ 